MSAQKPPQSRLAIERLDGDTAVIRFVEDQIDGHAVREFYEQVVQIIDHPNARLLVDLQGVEMVSSAAMGMCVTVKKKCLGVGAQMHLAIPQAQVLEQFQIMNLHMVLQIFSSHDEAYEAFKP